jgi:hypothetical protein
LISADQPLLGTAVRARPPDCSSIGKKTTNRGSRRRSRQGSKRTPHSPSVKCAVLNPVRDLLFSIFCGIAALRPDDRIPAESVREFYAVWGWSGCGNDTYTIDDADFMVTGNSAYQAIGDSISAGRDVNGDGYNDLLCGRHYGGTAGSAFLVYGPLTDSGSMASLAALEVVPWDGYSELGNSLSLDQDLDDDGHADIVIGAPFADFENGATMIWYGPTPEGRVHAEDADAVLHGEAERDGSRAGRGIFGVGDINEDGYEDVFIGALEHSTLLLGGPR